ncbi:MAG: A/G-specific adenine glycosylase [Vulcanimicrobiaceae bacterium]
MTRAQRRLLHWYRRHGRTELPWRASRDPYRVLVSEFMLQQTQVQRVIPKFNAFVARFPDFATLAAASTADVVRAWSGLGYTSRAGRLKRIAEAARARFDGTLPNDETLLRSLPGMGPYTVAALRAFAFGADVVALDTNVRRVTHRLHFGVEHPPRALHHVVLAAGQSVPLGKAHAWNSALMDLGALLCTARAPKCGQCPLRADCRAYPVAADALERLRVRHAPKRSPQAALPFSATTRFARGRIVDGRRARPAGPTI